MTTKQRSKFEFYSFGIVVKAKEPNSSSIEVYPVEELPEVGGSLKDYKQSHQSTLPNIQGTNQKGSLESTATLSAEWLPDGVNNRHNAPDVQPGEGVKLYRYGDDDNYYWTTVFNEPSLRRTENVLYLYGGTQKYGETLDKDNSYWINVNTVDGLIQLHTSTANGEPYTYDFTINTKEGYVELKDDNENLIRLNSRLGELIIDVRTILINANISQWGDTEMEGNVHHLGNTNQEGNLTRQGNTDQQGNVTHQGDTNQNGNIQHQGNTDQQGILSVQGDILQNGTRVY